MICCYFSLKEPLLHTDDTVGKEMMLTVPLIGVTCISKNKYQSALFTCGAINQKVKHVFFLSLPEFVLLYLKQQKAPPSPPKK